MKVSTKIRSFLKIPLPDFDHDFYIKHYPDLKHITSYHQAVRHYRDHGKAEGRFPNKNKYICYLNEIYPGLIDEFDIQAYKLFNKDLVRNFHEDDDFLRHFMSHGYKEGRLYKFADDERSRGLEKARKWEAAFSSSEFIAWCGAQFQQLPSSRQEAIAIFLAQGIHNLWPISTEFAFDAEYVRQANPRTVSGLDDAELYRQWLTEGFPSGAASNEALFLRPYLDARPFPSSFDWQAYVRKAGLPRAATRSQALAHLFDTPSPMLARYIGLMHEDAGWLLERIAGRALAQEDARHAAWTLEVAANIKPLSSGSLCLLGQAQHKLGEPEKALAAFDTAMSADNPPLQALLSAARIHVDRREFEQAFAILRQPLPAGRSKAEFGEVVKNAIESYFEHRSAHAHALYREAHVGTGMAARDEADALLAKTLDEIRALYAELDNLPASAGPAPAGYIAILANHDLPQCTHYRIEQKVRQFRQVDIPVLVFPHHQPEAFIESLVGARAAIFYRVGATPGILRAILHATSMGLPTFYEIDDLIFDQAHYPEAYESFEGQISSTQYQGLQFAVPLLRYALTMCDAAIASTLALSERMRPLTRTGTGIVLSNGLDERNAPAIAMGRAPLRREHGRVRIFYGSGTKAHNADFNTLVGPALLKLMQRYPHVDLVVVGHLKLRLEFDALGARIRTFPFIAETIDYWAILAACDINISVLSAGAVADCKSEIKWLEAAVLRIPSIVSDTATYREVIAAGTDGLIAASAADWHEYLDRLTNDPILRAHIGANAHAKAMHNYDLAVGAAVLEQAFARPKPRRPGALRVLICNVFFHPQSYGGATRVAEDNVRRFVADYPDLEIGIFCSDEGVAPAGRLRMGSFGDVPVFRLSTAQGADIDWTPFDPDNAEGFERVLDHFRPDLIHFHCIQRLTGTIVDVALRRAIPYLVTLHDGWWISDHQFLVDSDGLLQLPTTDVLADCIDRPGPALSISRRQRLAALLMMSCANLSVSAPFAQIYEKAGIPHIRVVENGISAIIPAVPAPRQSDRVALGHVGGRSAQKGASLIEIALRQRPFNNLHLTMIDGTLSPGQSIETVWGTTPVTLLGPYPQAQVADLYARLDVLLAPSTWPESFGLVTREALACGLWVVASNLGAIGQDVETGHNGFIVDVRTTKDLVRVFETIDCDPGTYRTPPDYRPPRRSAADQAAELYTIYREIAGTAATKRVSRETDLKNDNGDSHATTHSG